MCLTLGILSLYFFFSSSGDLKVGTPPQGVPLRHKKGLWTSATLAQEAKELTRMVRAILEVDCKWTPRSNPSTHEGLRILCVLRSLFLCCPACGSHWTESDPPRKPAVVNCPPHFSADLLDAPTKGEWCRTNGSVMSEMPTGGPAPSSPLPNSTSAPANRLWTLHANSTFYQLAQIVATSLWFHSCVLTCATWEELKRIIRADSRWVVYI